MREIAVAISPCPNDLFFFAPWIKGYVGKELRPKVSFADIDQLNSWAMEKKFPLIKASFYCMAKLQDDYELLTVGAALGFGCGPKIVSLKPSSLSEISNMRIAIPGKLTTAHLLLQTFAPPPKEKVFCTYDKIGPLLKQGSVDAGLIIHESRFTFQKEGFYEIADLGELWERATALPLPLGGLALSRELPSSQVCTILQQSYDFAKEFPEAIKEEILHYSQEKDLSVVKAHIDLYVNEETRSLSSLGKKAIEELFTYASGDLCPS